VIVKEKSEFRGYKSHEYEKGVCWVKLGSAD